MTRPAVHLLAWVAVLAAAGVLGRAGWQHLRNPRELAASLRPVRWVARRVGGTRLTRAARAWGGLEAGLALAVIGATMTARTDVLRPATAAAAALLLAYTAWLATLRRIAPGSTCACTGRPVPVTGTSVARSAAMAAMFATGPLLADAPPWLGAGERSASALIALVAGAAIGVLLWVLPDAVAASAVPPSAIQRRSTPSRARRAA
jgi:hypothetical protein